MSGLYTIALTGYAHVWGGRHDGVLGAIRSAIVTCQLPPGSRLVQDELAARFGVSRIPLREALRTLEAEGLVLSEPNRGAICRPLEPRDVSELYGVRLALERLACRSAAERRVDLRAATASKRRQAEAAAARHDLATLIELDSAFHLEVASAADNRHLTDSLVSSWSQIERAMHYYFTLDQYPENAWSEHESIAAAIAAGDGDVAEQRVEAHILRSLDAILKSLKRESVR